MQPPDFRRADCGVTVKASPHLKLLTALLFVALISLLPPSVDRLYAIPGGLLAVAAFLTRLSVRFALRRLLLAQVFIAGISLLSLFTPGMAHLFLSTWLKSNLCVLAVVILAWSTPMTEILAVMKQLRMPSMMVTTLALMWRYIPVLGSELRRMERARASRTFNDERIFAWHNLATIASQLFLRANERAQRIYSAMCARGWK